MRPVVAWLPAAGWAAVIFWLSSRSTVPAPGIPNVDKVAHTVSDGALRGKRLALHPVHRAANAADKRAAQARFDSASGSFTVPARTAVVFVAE